MKKRVAVIGAGGHARVVADIIQRSGDQVIGFFDDFTANKTFLGLPILGKTSDWRSFGASSFIIAIGDAGAREHFAAQMEGADWYTAIHPQAVVADESAAIGEGTVVMANAVINPNAAIGRHCIVNTCAIVEHDVVLSDIVHISPGAKLGGGARIGRRTWLGIGSTVKDKVSICGDCTIGAGAVVVKDISEPGTYIGVPIHRLK